MIENPTSSFQPLIGPKDQRVLLLSNVKRRVTDRAAETGRCSPSNYAEQITWRDAATARHPRRVGLFEPMTIGFGGRVYFDTGKGFIVLAGPAEGETLVAGDMSGRRWIS